MTQKHKSERAILHIGNVGGSVVTTVGGDIVAGDKITNTTTRYTFHPGFAAQEQKQMFEKTLGLLGQALQAIKSDIEAHPALSPNQKSEILGEVAQQLKSFREISEKTQAIPVGKAPPTDVVTGIDTALGRAGRVMDKLQDLASKAGAIGQKVGEFSVKYAPLILEARRLFGLS